VGKSNFEKGEAVESGGRGGGGTEEKEKGGLDRIVKGENERWTIGMKRLKEGGKRGGPSS